MKRILHKLSILTFSLLLLIFLSSTTVYAGSNNNPTQVKIAKCYPNPAVSVINFEFSSNVSALQIYSFTGKKMSDISITSSKITVTLDNNYYRGLYIYQLRDKSGRIIETGKFQVVR